MPFDINNLIYNTSKNLSNNAITKNLGNPFVTAFLIILIIYLIMVSHDIDIFNFKIMFYLFIAVTGLIIINHTIASNNYKEKYTTTNNAQVIDNVNTMALTNEMMTPRIETLDSQVDQIEETLQL